MADTKKAEMEALWEKLENQSSAGQLKKASKTADEILQLDNVNPTALHAKGALLVQRGNHEELLKFLEKPSGKRVETELAFEKAYCLYRLSRFQEALEALEAVREDRAAARLHLQAQLSHRLGHSKDSIAVYRELFSKHKDESLELRTNVLAAYVENQRAEEIPEVMEAMKISADKSYEIAFNQACGLLAGAKYTEAEALLLLAQRIGQEALYSEDLTEEEVTEEMAPVKAQLAFAAASLGRDSEAIEMLGEAIKAAKGDPATRAVAENNLVVSRLKVASSHKGLLGESLKHLEALMARPGVTTQLELQPALQLRLTPAQQLVLHHNRVVLMIMAGKNDSAKEIVKAMCNRWPGDASIAMLQATLMASDGKLEEADKLLAEAGGNSGTSQDVLLMRAQLLSQSQPERAADLLGSLTDESFTFAPHIIFTQVALLRRAGATAKLQTLLESAIAHWEPRMDTDGTASRAVVMGNLLEAQAQAFMEAGQVRKAADCLSKLREKYRPDDMALLVKLLKTTMIFDIKAATKLGAELPPVEFDEEPDVEAELQAIVSRGGRGQDKADRHKVTEAGKIKKKRKRKPIYPKGFDPANPGPPPDPERWLPLNQRSNFRKKKRGQQVRAQQAVVKGSQGAGKVDAKLDRSVATTGDTGTGSSSGAGTSLQPPPSRKGKRGKN